MGCDLDIPMMMFELEGDVPLEPSRAKQTVAPVLVPVPVPAPASSSIIDYYSTQTPGHSARHVKSGGAKLGAFGSHLLAKPGRAGTSAAKADVKPATRDSGPGAGVTEAKADAKPTTRDFGPGVGGAESTSTKNKKEPKELIEEFLIKFRPKVVERKAQAEPEKKGAEHLSISSGETPPVTPPRKMQGPPGLGAREYPTLSPKIPSKLEVKTIALTNRMIVQKNMRNLFGQEFELVASTRVVADGACTPLVDAQHSGGSKVVRRSTSDTGVHTEGWHADGSRWAKSSSDSCLTTGDIRAKGKMQKGEMKKKADESGAEDVVGVPVSTNPELLASGQCSGGVSAEANVVEKKLDEMNQEAPAGDHGPDRDHCATVTMITTTTTTTTSRPPTSSRTSPQDPTGPAVRASNEDQGLKGSMSSADRATDVDQGLKSIPPGLSAASVQTYNSGRLLAPGGGKPHWDSSMDMSGQGNLSDPKRDLGESVEANNPADEVSGATGTRCGVPV